jgi:hypothetical protein
VGEVKKHVSQSRRMSDMGKAYATAIMDMTRLASSGSRSALCGFRSARTSKTILSVS